MDALFVPFLHPLNDTPSFLPSVMCLVVFMARPWPFQECISILGFLGHVDLLRFCDCIIMFASRIPWQNLPRCAPFVMISSCLFLSLVCMFLSLVSRPRTIYVYLKIRVICYGFVNNTLFLNSSDGLLSISHSYDHPIWQCVCMERRETSGVP